MHLKDLKNIQHNDSRNAVSGIMQDMELKAIQIRSFVPWTTDIRHRYHVNDILLESLGKPEKTNQVWIGDTQ